MDPQKDANMNANSQKSGQIFNDPIQQNFGFTNAEETRKGLPNNNIDFILDIPLEITVELGRTKMMVCDLLKLGQGSVIELSKLAGDTLEILANNKLIAKGEVIVLNEKYGIRMTEVISPVERIEKLK
jgi:flagellar motor switch protein FliN